VIATSAPFGRGLAILAAHPNTLRHPALLENHFPVAFLTMGELMVQDPVPSIRNPNPASLRIAHFHVRAMNLKTRPASMSPEKIAMLNATIATSATSLESK